MVGGRRFWAGVGVKDRKLGGRNMPQEATGDASERFCQPSQSEKWRLGGLPKLDKEASPTLPLPGLSRTAEQIPTGMSGRGDHRIH